MKTRFRGWIRTLAGGVLLAAGAGGCVSLPNCSLLTPGAPTPAGDQAEQLIAAGDEWRDLAHQTLYKKMNWALGYCQASEAERYYRYVLETLEPHNAYAMLNLGYLALMKSHGAKGDEREIQLGTAYARLNEALELRRGYAPAHMYLGEYYVLRKEYDKAIAEYRKLTSAGLGNSYIYAWAGYAAQKMGKTSEAKQLFRKAVERGDREEAVAWARKKM